VEKRLGFQMDRLPVSAAIITKNEEENIVRCIRSLFFASQIVVVDSGSTDKTVSLAKELGAEVFLEPWRGGFGVQKQLAVDLCREDWILVLDADECVPPETAEKIREICLTSSDAAEGYSFPRKNYFQGRWVRHAGWWPDRVTRLFKRGKGHLTEAAVHEAIIVEGRVQYLDVPIEHYTESDLGRILEKINHYSTLGAETAFREGRSSSVTGAFFRAFFTFVQDYIIRLGCLDGAAGLTLAVTDAVNKFCKYAKLAEMGRLKR